MYGVHLRSELYVQVALQESRSNHFYSILGSSLVTSRAEARNKFDALRLAHSVLVHLVMSTDTMQQLAIHVLCLLREHNNAL